MGYLLYGLLAIASGLIVAAEMATYSTRRDRLIALSEAGSKSARLALLFLRAPRWYLAGSQLALTLTTTIMGLLSSALFSQPLQEWFASRGMAPELAQTVGFGCATALLTLFLTIFVNLLPKRIAFAYADATAMAFARAAWVWIKVTRPLLVPLNWGVDLLSRALKLRETGDSNVTESDVLTILREGRRDQLIDPHEFEIVRNALRLSDLKITEVMTPRSQIEWIDLRNLDPGHLAARLKLDRSQIPVADGSLDNVIGYVKLRELYVLKNRPNMDDVRRRVHPGLRIPTSASALSALNELRRSESRLAFVCDEHAHVVGLASLNDLVEIVLGPVASISDCP